MTCSIVVPVYGQADLTERCLATLLGAGHSRVPFDVIVVDDGSQDRTQEVVAELGGLVRAVRHDTNLGFATACNDGAAATEGELLVFLNNDTVPQRGWLDELVAYAEAHPAAVVVGAKLLYPDDTVQHAGVVIDQYRFPKHIYAGFPAWHPAVSASRRFQAVTAACMLVKREAFERLGGFDPAFANGYEDVDLCLRAADLGEVHYCAESVVCHLESMSDGRFAHAAENERLWEERWVPQVVPDDFRYYADDGLIGISYTDPYPIRLDLSPLLAVVDGDEIDRRTDHLLGLRSRRSFAMTKEIARLTGGQARRPRRVAEGTARWLSPTPVHRLVSVLVQAGSASETVLRVVEGVFSQQAHEIVEVVVVDGYGTTSPDLGVTVVDAADPVEIEVGELLAVARGEIVVLLAPEAEPADGDWLAPLIHRLDHAAAAGSEPAGEEAMYAVAAHSELLRKQPPAGLHPSALRAWGDHLVELESRSRVLVRELSPLERFVRGAAEQRLGGGDAEDGIAATWPYAGDVAEALGRMVERGRRTPEARAWVEDATIGSTAAGVWGAQH